MLVKLDKFKTVNPDHVVSVFRWSKDGVVKGSSVKLTDGNHAYVSSSVDEVTAIINGNAPAPRLITLTDVNGNDVGVDPSLIKTVAWSIENDCIEVDLEEETINVLGPASRIGEVIAKVNRTKDYVKKPEPEPTGRTLEV